MINGEKLIVLLEQHDKDRFDLVDYICRGLSAYTYDHCLIAHPIITALWHRMVINPGILPPSPPEKEDVAPFEGQMFPDGELEETQNFEEWIEKIIAHENADFCFVPDLDEPGKSKRSWNQFLAIKNPSYADLMKVWGSETIRFIADFIKSRWSFEHSEVLGFIQANEQAMAMQGTAKTIPPYLNPKHPHYSTELAAAVNAWMAVYVDGWGKEWNKPRTRIGDHVTTESSKHKSWSHRGSITPWTAVNRIQTVAQSDKDAAGGAPSKGKADARKQSRK